MRGSVQGLVIVLCATNIVCDARSGETGSISDVSDDKEDLAVLPSTETVSPKKLELPEAEVLNAPNPFSAFKDRIRKRFSSVANYMYETAQPVRDVVHEHVYNTFGTLYEMGAPVRKALAESKHVRRGKIALEIWKNIELQGKTPEEKVRLLIDAISAEMTKHLPEYTKIQPLEIKTKKKYICAAKGLMKKLTTIELVDKHVKPIDNNSGFTIKIDYKFNDLHFYYNIFHIKVVSKLNKKGDLDIKFADNNVRITLQIPNFKQIFVNLLRKQCIVHVLNFEVTKLDFVKSHLGGKENSYRRKFFDREIYKYLKNDPELLSDRFRQRTLVEIHRALQTQDDWMCKDKEFGKLVSSKGGNLESFVASHQFEEDCGKVLFIEPWKIPEAVPKVEEESSSE